MLMRQMLCGLLAFSLVGGSLYIPVAEAALVDTEQVVHSAIQQQGVSEARERLTAMLARAEVVSELQHYGVDPALARSRVDNLSDEEVLQLAGQVEQFPAGGDSVIGALVLIFLVLLITDILGYTDIFPFVKK